MKEGRHTLAYSHFLGYDKGEDGKLVPNPEQAKTVKLIYDEFLGGMGLEQLAKKLKAEGHQTGTGSTNSKTDLIEKVAKDTGVTKADTQLMVDAIIGAMADELTNGGKIQIRHFGVFYINTTQAHKRFNPISGKELEIKDQKRIRFRPSKDLSGKLNGG